MSEAARVAGAAEMLDVGRTRVYALIGYAALQSVKLGGSGAGEGFITSGKRLGKSNAVA